MPLQETSHMHIALPQPLHLYQIHTSLTKTCETKPRQANGFNIHRDNENLKPGALDFNQL